MCLCPATGFAAAWVLGEEVREVTAVYSTEPRKTMPAPSPSCASQPLPNHHTLKHRLTALRVVRTRFVETEETRLWNVSKRDVVLVLNKGDTPM